MVDKIIEAVLGFLQSVFVHPEIITTLIAILPIVEVRLAIPIGIEYGMSFFKSWLFSFVGSSLITPLLLLVLIPFIRWLASTRVFRKIGSALYDKFEQKSKGVVKESPNGRLSLENKKMLGVFIFVAIPLPLTGVWTGCAVASIIGLKYWKSLVAVVSGNLTASLIILLLCRFFQPYIDYIITVLGIIAIVVVILLIVKIVTHKPAAAAQTDETASADETKTE